MPQAVWNLDFLPFMSWISKSKQLITLGKFRTLKLLPSMSLMRARYRWERQYWSLINCSKPTVRIILSQKAFCVATNLKWRNGCQCHDRSQCISWVECFVVNKKSNVLTLSNSYFLCKELWFEIRMQRIILKKMIN